MPRDQNLTKHGQPRCDASLPSLYGRPRRCENPATITILDRQLCGVHARQVIHHKQDNQIADLMRPARLLRAANQTRERARRDLADVLLAQVEAHASPTESFLTTLDQLARIEQTYVNSLHQIRAAGFDALAFNTASDYPLADDAEEVRQCRYVLQQVEGVVTGRERVA